MRFKTILFFAICSAMVSSCSTNYQEEKKVLLSKNDNPDLVTSFELDKTQAENYKAISEEEAKAKAEKDAAEAKAKPAPKKPLSKKEKAKLDKEAKVAAEPKKTTTLEPKTAAAKAVPINLLPANYPEDFKKYDEKSKAVWGKFKPSFYQGEESIMAVSYLGVTAGYITILSKEVAVLNTKSVFHYYARFKSSDAYRYFYWLDDKLDTYVEKTDFLPMKYSLVQREKKQNVDDLQLFDFKKMMTYSWYKRVKEGSNKDEKLEAMIPSLAQDSFSALQFVRGLPLIKGDIYEFPVITRGQFWLLKVEVMGPDTTSVNGKDVDSIKIRAETKFPGVLQKSGDINFWYGTGPERKLLKFQAKIKLGSLYGELVEYKSGTLVK
ncbi:MAG: DUF3108 domain-containing protein [Rhizobacter sp.]|nr:DUF3108 domain-containing protein [Bacteriovorax sp.]